MKTGRDTGKGIAYRTTLRLRAERGSCTFMILQLHVRALARGRGSRSPVHTKTFTHSGLLGCRTRASQGQHLQ